MSAYRAVCCVPIAPAFTLDESRQLIHPGADADARDRASEILRRHLAATDTEIAELRLLHTELAVPASLGAEVSDQQLACGLIERLAALPRPNPGRGNPAA